MWTSSTVSVGCDGRVGTDVVERRPADADPALEGVAGGEGDGGFDLVGRGLAQHVGERGDLLACVSRWRRPSRDAWREFVEQHAPVWPIEARARLGGRWRRPGRDRSRMSLGWLRLDGCRCRGRRRAGDGRRVPVSGVATPASSRVGSRPPIRRRWWRCRRAGSGRGGCGGIGPPLIALVAGGVSVTRCWDVLTVHRLLHGGWRASVARGVGVAARTCRLDSLPTMGQLGLLDWPGDAGDGSDDPEQPVRPDGHLRPEWTSGGWAASPDRVASWARLALTAAHRAAACGWRRVREPDRALSTARSESAAEFLCAELTAQGLPFDVGRGRADHRRGDRAAAAGQRRGARCSTSSATRRCCSTSGAGPAVDLRNPADVRAMLRRVGDRRARHAGGAARAVSRCPPGRRGVADVAQGGADRHHVRVPVAGRARRRRVGCAGRGRAATARRVA